jgi:multicomponent Na+:H+ antiporter subunit F
MSVILLLKISLILLITNVFIGLIRLLKGPRSIDSLQAFLLFNTSLTAGIVIISVINNRSDFLDVALVFSVLAGACAVVFVKRGIIPFEKESKDE